MKLDNLNHDNMYKYIVIIGLSLLLVPQFNITNLINNMTKQMEVKQEIDKNSDNLNKLSLALNEVHDEVMSKLKKQNEDTNRQIYEMNIYFPDGRRIMTREELEELLVILKEINNNEEYKIDGGKTIKNIVLTVFGGDNNYEEMSMLFNEIRIKLDDMDKFLDKNSEELNILDERLTLIEKEREEISKKLNDILYETKIIDYEFRFYNKEKIIIDIFRIIGSLMIIMGLFLWYVNIQKYHDDIYKRNVFVCRKKRSDFKSRILNIIKSIK